MPRYMGLMGFLKGKNIPSSYEYGNSGDFEVFVGETLIFSKQQQGRYPTPPEVF